jgi:hypothetical protein
MGSILKSENDIKVLPHQSEARHELLRLRRLIRSRLVWLLHRSLYLIPGGMKFFVKVFPRFAKFVHALPQAPRQFRKLFGTEQDQHYYQNEYPF